MSIKIILKYVKNEPKIDFFDKNRINLTPSYLNMYYNILIGKIAVM